MHQAKDDTVSSCHDGWWSVVGCALLGPSISFADRSRQFEFRAGAPADKHEAHNLAHERGLRSRRWKDKLQLKNASRCEQPDTDVLVDCHLCIGSPPARYKELLIHAAVKPNLATPGPPPASSQDEMAANILKLAHGPMKSLLLEAA